MTRLLIVAMALIPAAGCASNRPVRGWVQRPELGKPFVDFSFSDDRGTPHSLGDYLGDYTVLAFTRCDTDTHRRAAELLEAMVAENRGDARVKVVGIDVHWSTDGCEHHEACHLVDAKKDLVSICDATGAIRRLYGTGPEDWLCVIGPDGKVELSSPARQGAALRAELKERTARLSASKKQERPQEYELDH